jgi:hypothetical protein
VRPRRRTRTAASAEERPHGRKYLLMVNDFLRRLLELHPDYVDEVERKLA